MDNFLEKLHIEHGFNQAQLGDIMKKMNHYINQEQTNIVTKSISIITITDNTHRST